MDGNGTLDTITILLIFLMTVITQIFLIGLITVLLKKIKLIIRSTPKKYYYFVFFYIFTKMILCVILEVKIITSLPDKVEDIDSQDMQYIFKNSWIIADCSIIELFLISFQHYLTLSFSVLGNQRIENTIKILMQAVQIITFFSIMIPLVIFNIGIINYELVNDLLMSLNCLSVLAFLVSFFFMNFKMTGLLIEKRSSELIKKVYKLLLMILVSRMIMGALEILVSIEIKSGNFEDFIEIIEQNQGKYVTLALCFILYMLMMLITQGLPLMISLRESLIVAFTSQKERKSSTSDDNMIREQLLINESFVEQKKASQGILDRIGAIRDVEDKQNLYELDDYMILKGKFHEVSLFIRELSNISNYISEEVVQEIENINKLSIKSLNRMKLLIEEEKIFIIEKYLPSNLDTKMLHIKSEDEKIQLAIKIAEAIQDLHQENYAHGSLNPKNIMIDGDGNVVMTGYGLESLRKYLSLITEYSNLSVYTAAQLLGPRQRIVSKQTKQSDIYSFGIIFYELMTDIKTYRELELGEVRKKFKEQNFRPKIPQMTSERIKKLLRMCWQQNPKNRPQISQVIRMLRSVSQITL